MTFQEIEKERAEEARARVKEEQARKLAEWERERAEKERDRLGQEKTAADAAADKLRAQLRALGIEPQS